MKTKEQMKRTLELFSIAVGKFRSLNTNNEFGGGKIIPDPVFIKQLQALLKEILPTTEEIRELAADQATDSTFELDARYEGFIQGAECIVKSITE